MPLIGVQELWNNCVNAAQDALKVELSGGGTAGTPAGSVQTVQGAESATPIATVGRALPVRVTLATSASPDYSAGDSLGGKITLANAVRVAGGASRLENLLITDKSNQKPSGYIYIFDADPDAATITDNAAVAFSTDVSKIIARIDVSAADYITTGTIAVADVPYAGRLLKSAATTSLWACWVCLSTPNLAAVDDISVLFNLTAQS